MMTNRGAWLVALPSVLNIRERDPFRVDMKLPFCGVRHYLLKGIERCEVECPQCPELLAPYCVARLLEA